MSDDDFLGNLKKGEKNAIRFIYDNFKSEGLGFIGKLGFSGTENEDVFQDAIVSLLTNIKAGKFQGNASIKTYFFSILKFTAYGHARKEKKLAISSIDGYDVASIVEEETYDDLEISNLRSALKKLDEKCRTLLTGYYFEQVDLRTLADTLELTYNFVRQKKLRCLKSLRSSYENIV